MLCVTRGFFSQSNKNRSEKAIVAKEKNECEYEAQARKVLKL